MDDRLQFTDIADTIRCPYCTLGVQFRPMVAHLDGRYICKQLRAHGGIQVT
jgi:hypothetical protein